MASPSVEAECPPPELNIASGSSLLLHEREKMSQRCDCKTGIKSIDAQFPDLFQGGNVIGIGQTEDREGAAVHEHHPKNLILRTNTTQCLSTHIIASTLVPPSVVAPTGRNQDKSSKEEPEVFLLAPPTSTIISDLHSLLQSRVSSTSPIATQETALKLLDNVKLLQYLDIAGLAEGLSEISQTVHGLQQDSKREAVLLVKGLSGTFSSAQRRSGTVQVAALASNISRTLTHLSRSYPRLLVLVEFAVEVGVRDSDEGGNLESAFAGEKEEMMGVAPRGVVGEVLEHGMDVIVVIHDGFGKARKAKGGGPGVKTRIVEAVKDRVGGRRGECCIWV